MNTYINDVTDSPKAIGPYSQAVSNGNMVFVSGQIPLDPKTSKMIAGGIKEQTEQVLKNMTAILSHLGLNMANVARTTIFLTDLSNFEIVNEIYAKHMGDAKPARATVQVSALPKGSLVEIDCIAIR